MNTPVCIEVGRVYSQLVHLRYIIIPHTLLLSYLGFFFKLDMTKEIISRLRFMLCKSSALF